MKRRNQLLMQLDPLSPFNWDFRVIPEHALRGVILYEYRRSWEEFQNQITRTLEGKIGRKRIRDYLLDYWSRPTEESEEKMFKRISKVAWETWKLNKTGKLNSGDFSTIYESAYCYFPAPFTWLIQKEYFVIKKEKRPYSWVNSPVKIVTLNKSRLDDISFAFSKRGGSVKTWGYHLMMDFNATNNEKLVNQFALWLTREAKKHRTKNLRGKASSPSWHRLKQLAAKRLADGGLNFTRAQDLVREIQQKDTVNGYNDVLPCYASQGAWSDAVKAANLFLDDMKKNNLSEEWKFFPLYNL